MRFHISCGVLVALVAFTAAAHAGSISQTLLPGGAGSNGYLSIPWNNTYAFNTFDTTLGTLTSVTLEINDILTGSANYSGGIGVLGTGSFGVNVSDNSLFSLNSSPDDANSFFIDALSGSATGNAIRNTFTGSGLIYSTSDTNAESPSFFGLSDSDFTSVGAGTLNIYEDVTGGASVYSGNPIVAYGPQAYTGITIIYDYTAGSTAAPSSTAVPLPATCGTLALGMLALLLVRWLSGGKSISPL